MNTNPTEPNSSPAVKLDWTWHEAEYLACQTEKYARAVLTRVLPSLAELTPDEMRAVAEYPEAIKMPSDIAPAGGDDLYSMLLRDLGEVRHELFGLAFAGLFHLFERTLMGALRRANGRLQGRLILNSERNLTLPQMQEILRRGRYPIEGSDFELSLKKLRLIAGSVKHADGWSARDLASEFPQLVRPWPGEALSIQSLALSEDLFKELANGVSLFWRGFPENVPDV